MFTEEEKKNYMGVHGSILNLFNTINSINKDNIIAELYEIAKNKQSGYISTITMSSDDYIIRMIESLKAEFEKVNVESSEDKMVYDILQIITNKYNLANVNELVTKLNNLINIDDTVCAIANNINTSYNNQIVTDIQSFSTFISNLINSMASYSTMQNNANNLFVNFNALANENALLKAENEQLKQKISELEKV